MLKSFSKLLVVCTMLIAFVGQAWAGAFISCEMPMGSNNSVMEMSAHAMMDHSTMQDMQPMHQSAEDCCDTDCVCPGSACSSVFYLHTEINKSIFAHHNESILGTFFQLPNSFSSSLYRPPITA